MTEDVDLVVRANRMLSPEGERSAIVLVADGRIVRLGGVDDPVTGTPLV